MSMNVIYGTSMPKVKISLPPGKNSLLHCHAYVAYSSCIRPVHSPQLGPWNIASGSAVEMWMPLLQNKKLFLNFYKRRRLYKMLKYEQGKSFTKTTVYIVLIRASEDNRLSGVVTSFFRRFGWFGTGFGHGAYHLCQNTCFVCLEKLRPWIIKVDDDWL